MEIFPPQTCMMILYPIHIGASCGLPTGTLCLTSALKPSVFGCLYLHRMEILSEAPDNYMLKQPKFETNEIF